MTTMSIKTLLNVAPKLPASKSVMIRGDHGKGKSQVARQIAERIRMQEKLENYPIIDRRFSQMSEGDVIGLPSTDGEVTRFNPPDWYKRACKEACFLFLDELNRATPEVMQTAFQIALDRELNGWKLHEQTRVYTAINTNATYTVNEVDPALLDRFWTIDLEPTTEDWLLWARSTEKFPMGGNLASTVIDFCASADKWLDPTKAKNIEPGTVTTSRRSWEHLSTALKHAGIEDEPENELFYPMCLGYIGLEATVAFTDFAKHADNRVSGEEILANYKKVKAKINRLGTERQNVCIEKLADYVTKNLDKINDDQGKNLKAFMTDLPGELRVACWAKLTKAGIDKLELAKSVHKWCAPLILDVFGVPMGEAGIGVVPNIPDLFKQKDEKK